LELFLPAQDAGFIAGFFGLGNHSFALVGAGDGGPSENVVRIECDDAAGGFNCAVKIFLGVVCLRETMERVGKFRIECESAIVLGNRGVELAVAKKINSRIVVVFGGHLHPSLSRGIVLSPGNSPSRC
jgi:hypothetical protein